MLPINQVILGGADPLLNTGSLTDQIQYLEEQKRLIEARQKQIQQAANGQQTLQQVSPQQTAKVSVWDLIDAEIEPLTNEQRSMLATNEEYVANYNNLQSMVRAEVLNLVRANIENSPEGKALLDNQLKLVKNLKTSIIEMSQREMQLFNAFKEASAKNPSLTFDFNIPVLGNGNISNGNITLSIPFINKGIMFNQSDLETFRQLLTK